MIRALGEKRPVVPATSYVDLSAQVLGDVVLGEQSSVWMNAVLRGDVHEIRVGDRTNIQDGAVLHGMRGLWPVHIGNGVTIGHNATVHGCVLEDDVLVGMGAVILNGARIGTGSIIGAGAVVREGAVVPPGSLYAGVPAKLVRTLDDGGLRSIRAYAEAYVGDTAKYLAWFGTAGREAAE